MGERKCEKHGEGPAGNFIQMGQKFRRIRKRKPVSSQYIVLLPRWRRDKEGNHAHATKGKDERGKKTLLRSEGVSQKRGGQGRGRGSSFTMNRKGENKDVEPILGYRQ